MIEGGGRRRRTRPPSWALLWGLLRPVVGGCQTAAACGGQRLLPGCGRLEGRRLLLRSHRRPAERSEVCPRGVSRKREVRPAAPRHAYGADAPAAAFTFSTTTRRIVARNRCEVAPAPERMNSTSSSCGVRYGAGREGGGAAPGVRGAAGEGLGVAGCPSHTPGAPRRTGASSPEPSCPRLRSAPSRPRR